MGRYVARRLLQMIPVFIGSTLLIFLLVNLTPGDPLLNLAGPRALDPNVRAQLTEQFHLDRNVFIQYLYFMKGVVTLDFGTTFSGRPVIDIMKAAFPITIRLAFLALAFEMLIGLPAGLIAGLRRGKLFDSTSLFASLIVIAIPVFVLGFVVQLFLAIKLGFGSPTVGVTTPWKDLVLPAVVLGSLSVAYILRLTRTSVAENARSDYVRTATAKGLGRGRVVTVHLLRNSLIPVVTFLGADLGALMGGAIVTEGIFNIKGVGGTLFLSITRGETATVVSIVTVLVLVFLIANLLVDLLYAVLDPRIRYA